MAALAAAPTNIHSREYCPLHTAFVHPHERVSLPSNTNLFYIYSMCIILISIQKRYNEPHLFLNGTVLVIFRQQPREFGNFSSVHTLTVSQASIISSTTHSPTRRQPILSASGLALLAHAC
jgi:hypothetical protein